jgi:tetratricopeptide (TPR) repeat protein
MAPSASPPSSWSAHERVPAVSQRLETLKKLVEQGNAEPFARYALALEYKKLGDVARALECFDALREAAPDYLPAYLMCAQLLVDAERPEQARAWATLGLTLAEQQGNAKAKSELSALIATLD